MEDYQYGVSGGANPVVMRLCQRLFVSCNIVKRRLSPYHP